MTFILMTYTFETYSVFARLLVAAASSYRVQPQLTLMDVRARSAVVLMLVDHQTYYWSYTEAEKQ